MAFHQQLFPMEITPSMCRPPGLGINTADVRWLTPPAVLVPASGLIANSTTTPTEAANLLNLQGVFEQVGVDGDVFQYVWLRVAKCRCT